MIVLVATLWFIIFILITLVTNPITVQTVLVHLVYYIEANLNIHSLVCHQVWTPAVLSSQIYQLATFYSTSPTPNILGDSNCAVSLICMNLIQFVVSFESINPIYTKRVYINPFGIIIYKYPKGPYLYIYIYGSRNNSDIKHYVNIVILPHIPMGGKPSSPLPPVSLAC